LLLPRYIIERSIAGLTREALFDAGHRSASVLADMPSVRWIRSYVSEVEGKMYCEYDAPSVDAIREHARRAGLAVDRISEIALEINPSMFV
jgi:Nickel responsive protein SCO4226-like